MAMQQKVMNNSKPELTGLNNNHCYGVDEQHKEWAAFKGQGLLLTCTICLNHSIHHISDHSILATTAHSCDVTTMLMNSLALAVKQSVKQSGLSIVTHARTQIHAHKYTRDFKVAPLHCCA